MSELRRARDVTASLAKLTFDIAAAGASARLPEPLQRGMGVVKFRRHLVAALRPARMAGRMTLTRAIQ